MKLQHKIALAISASLISGAAFATQIDYRHEWKAESKTQANRIKLGSGFKINDDWKTNVGVEMKFQSDDAERSFSDLKLTETELDLGATYKINKNWELKPGMPIAMTSVRTVIKPQLRVVYKADMGLTTALRYRYEVANYIDGEGKTGLDDVYSERTTQSKVTLTGAYKFEDLPNLKASYEANYWKSHNDLKTFDNGNDNYDLGLKVGYQLGDWQPYGEIWDSSVSSSHDQRQLKYRLGIKYKF
ncbi:membrane protein [Psychromonas marina]|uniref:Membrane protein n=1 Tax=Psychromonas marina TaxID=88364 RepID=A0ABQ6E2B6_9GAMM|nr:oligogalacturonate-specific porin KdgM family protein [Psychromonas marina]GLS91556.1 membrane protein [Psychromonas marina]